LTLEGHKNNIRDREQANSTIKQNVQQPADAEQETEITHRPAGLGNDYVPVGAAP